MAAIIYYDPEADKLRMKPASHEQAKKLEYALNHPETVTDDAMMLKLANIQAIHFAKQKVTPTVKADDVQHLTNQGIYQSMDSAVPNGDR